MGQLSSYFDAVVSGEDFEESKPAPDIYLHTLQELAVAPQECIAIEDSEKGIASAKEAGLEVWAMRDEHFGMDQSQADAFLTQLSDICKKLVKIGSMKAVNQPFVRRSRVFLKSLL